MTEEFVFNFNSGIIPLFSKTNWGNMLTKSGCPKEMNYIQGYKTIVREWCFLSLAYSCPLIWNFFFFVRL